MLENLSGIFANGFQKFQFRLPIGKLAKYTFNQSHRIVFSHTPRYAAISHLRGHPSTGVRLYPGGVWLSGGDTWSKPACCNRVSLLENRDSGWMLCVSRLVVCLVAVWVHRVFWVLSFLSTRSSSVVSGGSGSSRWLSALSALAGLGELVLVDLAGLLGPKAFVGVSEG